MSAAGAALADAAECWLGAPFRFGGRDPATGLDCIGLVLAALATIGRPQEPVPHYRLRQTSIDRFLPLIERAGLRNVERASCPGDIVLVQPAPGQFHLAILTSAGDFIHAHAGIGRIVRGPVPLPWPAAQTWRLF